MFLALLLQDPALFIIWLAAVMISLTLHEFSHALVAKLRGDSTAERAGRLSLNPLAHIDPIGFIAFLVVGFGWAKPVPYNPYNLPDPKWDAVKIGLAGPAMNLVVSIVAALGWHVSVSFLGASNLLTAFLFLLVILNLSLMIFNLIPIHPLDGAKLLFAIFDGPKYAAFREFVAVRGPQILLVLVVISIFTPFDPFYVVTAPANAICDTMLQTSCDAMMGNLFGS